LAYPFHAVDIYLLSLLSVCGVWAALIVQERKTQQVQSSTILRAARLVYF